MFSFITSAALTRCPRILAVYDDDPTGDQARKYLFSFFGCDAPRRIRHLTLVAQIQKFSACIYWCIAPRDNLKSLLSEMIVKGKGCIQSNLVHGLETDTVYQRKIAAIGNQESAHALHMNLFIHPGNFYDWQNIKDEQADRFNSKAVLEQGSRFQDDIVAAEQD